jgi:hypothetical protein
MSLMSRLLRRLGYVKREPEAAAAGSARPAAATLVEDPDGPPPQGLEITPWSAQRLAVIFNRCNQLPEEKALADARTARMVLSKFWLSAPVDQLEPLYRGEIGNAYRLLLAGRLPGLALDREEESWKMALARHLIEAFGAHETTNVLLAVLPFYERNGMRVADPLRQIPAWLLPDYAERCDPSLQTLLRQSGSAPLLPQGGAGATGNARVTMALPGSPPATTGDGSPPLPALAQRQGPECMPLIQDQGFLGRVSGLINLYAIDPNDEELKQDLALQRRQVAQVWMDVDTDQLERLYRTAFGQLTQNLIASGFWREPVSAEEDAARRQLAEIVAEMRHPRALNALMAALLYVAPTSVTINGPNLLPSWLAQELQMLAARNPSGVNSLN